MAPDEQRYGGWNKDLQQGEAEGPSGGPPKMLPCDQVLALSGDICALRPAWLLLSDKPGTGELKNGVQKRSAVKAPRGSPGEKRCQQALVGSSPRTSPSALPVLPRILSPRLQPPPSLEGVEEVLSSWGALVGVRGLLPSPHSQHWRAGHRKSEEVPGQSIHSLIHSFKAMHWGPTPCLAQV